jgi:hypothetical protein
MAAEQVYKLNGGFILRQVSNYFTQTAGHNKGYCSVRVSPLYEQWGNPLLQHHLYHQHRTTDKV